MSKKRKDPFYKREKEKYASPIPSREFILQVLEEAGRPMSRRSLMRALELEEASEEESLGFRLKAMVRDGQIMSDRRGRFCLVERINLQCGTIQAHPEGFGFFIPDQGGVDMVLSGREMQLVMHGDKVFAYQCGVDRRGRPEGKIHEVIEHVNHRVVGRYFTEHGVGFLIPDNKRLTQDISIPRDLSNNAENGQMVVAELVAFPTKRNQAIGRITQILGEHMAPGLEIDVAIFSHALPVEWPEEVYEAVKHIPLTVSEEDCKGRKDLRALPFVTIDGEDAKDFDDAVYCCPKPRGGYQLYVAIADVSHYVKPGTALDKEAIKRGNSVYFPGRVVPMLPEVLSNGICSLNPKVDRLALVAEMSISKTGKLTSYNFYPAVFHSQARLTYTQVAAWLTEAQLVSEKEIFIPSKPVAPLPQTLETPIKDLYELYSVLAKARKVRGAIEFETIETQIEFDEQRKIKRVFPLVRNVAHCLIEECMLAANVATARFLQKAGIPMMYRVHALPEQEKIASLKAFLEEQGLKLQGGKKPGPRDFQKILETIETRADKFFIQTVMLRSLKQAQYVEENNGHFGLAYPAYTHFTSPIRRYPDLIIHRAILQVLAKTKALTTIKENSVDTDTDLASELWQDEAFPYNQEEIQQLSKHCSMTERRADEAVREAVLWLKCEYMQDKLGEVFEGKITAVTGFGVFVELNAIYVEGLVHVTSLGSDYYTFDAIKHRLLGQRSGKIYRLGDKITVLVARVDLEERKIDFELAEKEGTDDEE